MKKILLLLSLSLLFIACSGDTQNINKETSSSAPLSLIKPIAIPFRAFVYSQYPSKVLSTQAELDKFLTQVSNESSWNNKTDFLAKIQDENIDFKTYNLLFYRMSEPSGSNKLNVKNDKIQLKNNEVTIVIERDIPKIVTSDIAYYALAYRVSKSLKSLVFDNGVQKVVVENKKSDMVIPSNCQAWYDGCNNCVKGGGCTKMACFAYRPQDFRCTKWK